MPYAERTTVPVARTRATIEAMLRKAGASRIVAMDEPDEAVVAFRIADRSVRMSRVFKRPLTKQEGMTFWRNLAASIRGKLAAVDQEIETVEEAFLAHVVMPDGSTVYERAREALRVAYETGEMRPLLPPPPKEPTHDAG